ncbi:MAG: alcohol dehydrogenase catalytic domain-containing protein [Kiritimatiellae bacterium]|nr:alcohol dehydrogenase catalytic domain-containing protein [Kiritimatiellia bacterium]
MKAARLYGRNDLRVEEVRVPSIRPGDLLLRVRSAFICGTDIRMLANGRHAAGARRPLIPGHELGGIVEKAAGAGAGLRAGARVTVAPNIGCGRCARCAAGDTHLCTRFRALGIHLDGGFAEFVRVPARAVAQGNVAAVPAGVSLAEAALAEPLSCVLSAAERAAVGPGDSVLVLGAGPIGLLHARLAASRGAAPVLLSDISAERLALCRKLNPDLRTLDASLSEAAVRRQTGRDGVDVCITACSSPRAQQQALELAGTNGRVVLFGGLPARLQQVALNTNLIHYKQLTVTGTTRSNPAQFRRALALIAGNKVKVKDLITATWDIARIHAAVQAAASGGGFKNEIRFNIDGKRPARAGRRRHGGHAR